MVTTEFWAIGMGAIPARFKGSGSLPRLGDLDTHHAIRRHANGVLLERGPGGGRDGRGQPGIHAAQVEPVVANGLDARGTKLVDELLSESGGIGRPKMCSL